MLDWHYVSLGIYLYRVRHIVCGYFGKLAIKNIHKLERRVVIMSSSKRMPKELYYLGIAESVSKRSSCLNKQWGAVIVKDDVIIATGYNGSPRGLPNCCETGSCYRIEHNIPRGTMYETCLTRDTMIMRPNGRRESVGSIFDHQQEHTRVVYGMNPNSHLVLQVPGVAINSGYRDELYTITFETGRQIRCTAEHRFLLEDRVTYVEAQNLKPLDHLAGVRWQHDPYRAGNEWLMDHTVTVADVWKTTLAKPVPVYDLMVPEYENFVISIGDNDTNIGIISHNCSAIHAEQNAIISAPRSSMLHSTMYIYGFDNTKNALVEHPDSCALCKRMIINAGIDQVIFADTTGICKLDHPTGEYGYRIAKVSDWISEYDPDQHGY